MTDNTSTRICFILRVKPEMLEEYRERHAAVWPEMLEALATTGWRNYSLFLDDDGLLVGYLETDDFATAQAAMAETAVNARWQAEMSAYFTQLEGRPDESMRVLPLVFNLEQQLAAATFTEERKTEQ